MVTPRRGGWPATALLALSSVLALPCGGALLRLQGRDAAELAAADKQADSEASGTGYCRQLWNRIEVFGEDGEHSCDYQKMSWRTHAYPNFKQRFLGGGKLPKLCLRGYTDMLSSSIKYYGHFPECNPLADWWAALPDKSTERNAAEFAPCGSEQPHGAAVPEKVFVDIGANTGSCLMPMLARPDVARAVAFEPNPSNLFYLTSSALANPTIKDKLSLYSIALGDEVGTHTMYEARGNAGHSVLDTVEGNVAANVRVSVGTLDEAFFAGEGKRPLPYIHLLKLDAEGYEVKILRGAKKLLASGAVNAVKLELYPKWLEIQNTTAEEYLNIFLQNRYQLYDLKDVFRQAPLTADELHSAACDGGHKSKQGGFTIYEDLVAVRRAPEESMQQGVITC